MRTKMLWGAAFLALAAILVVGAVYRTSAQLGSEGDVEAEITGTEITRGTVQTVDAERLVVLMADGSQLIVEGQPWAYAVGRDFTCQPGEGISLTGYFENDEFKAMQLTTASGAAIMLRDADGRPGWAGQGRGH